jgi:hypothetical protein
MTGNYTCSVCGYPSLKEPPHDLHGSASFEICPSCGYQFGYDDDARGISHENWRRKWISSGSKWWSPGGPAPDDWDPAAQLAKLAEVLGPDFERLV